MLKMRPFIALFAVTCVAVVAGCSGIKTEASYPADRPKGTDKIIYSDQKKDTIWGEGETLSSRLLGGKADEDSSPGIGVNSFLWRAALDTVAFMPVASADPFGGVILTDWYENPDSPGERFKLNVYILDRQLRSDGVRVSVFRQQQRGGGWKDSTVAAETGTNIENTILTRARELRVAQAGRDKQ
jgi:hypothetical protein